MLKNTGQLSGKTLFITGASRGIGKAIALKAAQDGANIVIAAKTAEPHLKLPGTIFTAAKEVEEAGGKCLPCIVDIRDDGAIFKAVQDAVKKFGGIDILVNNASAISLTGTLDTTTKKYDLMNSVNARGTFLCSKACLRFLKKAQNPHILNITPPLNMKHEWFKDNLAYSISKFGMTLCVLGMSQEFKNDGIAVNGLWPKKPIATVAVEVMYSKEALAFCRTDQIMADAAYALLTKNSRTRTGEFLYDEDILKQEGITDYDQYLVSPEALKTENTSPTIHIGSVSEVFERVHSLCNEELVQSINGIFEFHLSGKEPGVWYLDLKNNSGNAGRGSFRGDPGCTMILDSEDFVKMFQGQLNPVQAFMGGKMEVKGDKMLAAKLEKLMGSMKSKL